MDFYVINRFAQDGSLLAREPAPDLPTARKTAFDMADPQTIPFLREVGVMQGWRRRHPARWHHRPPGRAVKRTQRKRLRNPRQQTETWGLERKPFEPDGTYFVRVALLWKKRALAAEARLKDLDK